MGHGAAIMRAVIDDDASLFGENKTSIIVVKN
jgi:hypothetical protein